jgi:hypothetical protein
MKFEVSTGDEAENLACMVFHPSGVEVVAVVSSRKGHLWFFNLEKKDSKPFIVQCGVGDLSAVDYTPDGLHLVLFTDENCLHIVKRTGSTITPVSLLQDGSWFSGGSTYTYNISNSAKNFSCRVGSNLIAVSSPRGYIALMNMAEIQKPQICWESTPFAVTKNIRATIDGQLVAVLGGDSEATCILHFINPAATSSTTDIIFVASDPQHCFANFAFVPCKERKVAIASCSGVPSWLVFNCDALTADKPPVVIRRICGSGLCLNHRAYSFANPSQGLITCNKTGQFSLVSANGSPEMVYALKDFIAKDVTADDVEAALRTTGWATQALPSVAPFSGRTLLHCAVLFDRPDWVSVLCKHGAHPLMDCVGHLGTSSIDLALDMLKFSIASKLVDGLVEHTLSRYPGLLPRSFSRTIVRLIKCGIPCEKAITMMRPLESFLSCFPPPPQQSFHGGVATDASDRPALKEYSKLATPPLENQIASAVEIHICRIPGLLDEKVGLIEALSLTADTSTFQSPVLQAAIYHLWGKFGYRRFLCIFALVFLRLLAFLLVTASASPAASVVLVALNFLHLLLVTVQATGLGWVFLSMPSHVLEVVSIVSSMAVGCAFITGNGTDAIIAPAVLALIALFIWMDFLLHFGGFSPVSALLTQTRAILSTALPFLLLLSIAVAGFTHSRLCLGMPSYSSRWADWPGVDVANMLLSTHDDLVHGGKSIMIVSDDESQADGYHVVRSIISLMLSTLGTVVLLNMLIAIMSDTFEIVQVVLLMMHEAAAVGSIYMQIRFFHSFPNTLLPPPFTFRNKWTQCVCRKWHQFSSQ